PWYKAIGQGMGAALNTAASMNAYTLADRGTWLSFKNRGELDIAVEGDKRLFNQYGVMLVNPQKYPHAKAALGQQFIDWHVSEDGPHATRGWARNPRVDTPVTVDFYVDGKLAGSTVADRYRADLVSESPHGRCAFEYTIPAERFDGSEQTIEVRARGATKSLTNGRFA